MKVVLASGNQGKLRELKKCLEPFGYDLVPQTELGVESPSETGLTFIENALIKARHASKITGLPALADDSGLAVAALGGAPGIYSARYAGEGASDQDNINKLLLDLKEEPQGNRQATFHCVLVFMMHEKDPTPIVCDGQWQGRILEQESGEQGFGYDPIFYSPEFDCSAALLSKDQKNSVSHRGKAIQALTLCLEHRLDI